MILALIAMFAAAVPVVNGDQEWGKTGGDKSSARITGKSCDFDRDAGVVLFEGDVKVEYAGEYTLTADKVYAFTVGTNELSRVVATGNVVISNGTRIGTCPMATYRRRRREIEMFGDGKEAMAHLEDRGKNASAVDGTRIRFWLDAEQFEVENSTIRVQEDGRRNLL